MATMTEIEKIQKQARQIANGKHPTIRPGQPIRFPEAASELDTIRQGDLYLTVCERVPSGYVRIDKPKDSDRQLVPGNTQGAKHCLDSLEGVELYRPKEWTEETLEGPYMRLAKERTVLHPTHGSVTLVASMGFHCTYQREWSREQAKERRARD